MRSWEEVHRLHEQENKSAREIARSLGMSRNTVGRLLALTEPPRYKRSSGSKLDPYRAAIIGLLQREPTMPAAAVYRRLVELGYEGGTTALRAFVATVRQDLRQRHPPTALSPVEPDSAPGMNLISADFEIVMVNRVNQRLFRKPVGDLLGKKCYREFERRDDVCPHCPGLVALTTGAPAQVESRGIRDDGTKYAVRLTAHPIMAPSGNPLGWVEVEEDITERKRSEGLARLVEDLQASLSATRDVDEAIRRALNVAFSLEGVDFGCAYVWDSDAARYRAVSQRGASRALTRLPAGLADYANNAVTKLDPARLGEATIQPVAGVSDLVELVPIAREGVRVGLLLLGSSTYTEFPPTTHAALEALANIVGAAVASLRALQLERETRADLVSLLSSLPVPAWCSDGQGRITFWNREAERVFGWAQDEVNDSPLPREAGSSRSESATHFSTKSGAVVRAHVTKAPAPRALGGARQTLSLVHSLSALEVDTQATVGPGSRAPAESGHLGERPARVLLLESERVHRAVLTRILRSLGFRVRVCRDATEVIGRQTDARRSGDPYQFVIAELLPAGGTGGLELAGALRRSDSRSRVILTADSQIVGFESHGIAGVLRKPYEPEMVRRQVMGLLGGGGVQ